MATPRYPGPTSVFVPAATRQVVGYIQTPGRYRLRDYTQWVKGTGTDAGTNKPIAGYWILDPDAPVRTGPAVAATANPDPQGIGGGPDNQWRWDPAQKRPPANIAANFKFITAQMERRNYGWQIDEQTDQTADLPIKQVYRDLALNYAMLMKTIRVIKMLELVANWPASNTADVNTLNGGKGKWNLASSDELSPNAYAIRKALIQAQIIIALQTNNVVQPSDLRCVVSPNLAYAMGSSGEIYGYLKSSQFSQEVQAGRNERMESFGLPRFYAGMEFIVEGAVNVQEEINVAATAATNNRVFVKNDTSAVIVSRAGGINGVQGAPSFSTVQCWFYKYEMSVESYRDTWNKLEQGAVVDQFAEVFAANRAGMLLTNCI